MNTKIALLSSSIFLTACGSGGSETTPVEPITVTPPPEPTALEISIGELREIMDRTSPTGSYEGYILPESDDFLNIPQDPSNPITAEKVELGKFIYHETGITDGEIEGTEGTFSCASCHNAQNGFKSGIRQGIGEGGVGFDHRIIGEDVNPEDVDVQPVTSPTVLNTAYQEVMLWNGQFGNVIGGIVNIGIDPERHFTEGTPKEANLRQLSGLETQAVAGLSVHRMGVDEENSILTTNEKYQMMFEAAYGTSQPHDMLEAAAFAIAAYERTILANQAPFQNFLRGDEEALTLEEVEGAKVFFGKGNCAGCHNGPALSSPVGSLAQEMFMTLGFHDLDMWEDEIIGEVDEATKEGRAGFTGDEMEKYAFKVPPLYNLIDTTVFGHGASFTSVEDVVRYKVAAVPQHPEVEITDLDYRFAALDLTEEEVTNLVMFLEKSLHDPDLMRYVPEELPSGNCVTNNDEESRRDLGCNDNGQ
jgi:cytochrome c peroxidase